MFQPTRMSPVAIFEDTGERREVVAWCATCRASIDDWPDVIVSPTGWGHLQDDDGTEKTRCRRDATADGWWWHL